MEINMDKDKLLELAEHEPGGLMAINPDFINDAVSLEIARMRMRIKELEGDNAELVEACKEAVKLLENPNLYPSDCQPCYGMLRGAIRIAKSRCITGD